MAAAPPSVDPSGGWWPDIDGLPLEHPYHTASAARIVPRAVPPADMDRS